MEIGETLHFWLLSFSPVYARDPVRAGLKAALARTAVKSVAVYEMFGVYDLLVRVWLPDGCSGTQFQKTMLAELKPHGLEMCDSFTVEYPVRHWVFGDHELKEPPMPAVRRLARDSSRIEEFEQGTMTVSEVERLCAEQLLALPTYKPDQLPGIKFAVVVSGQSRPKDSGQTGNGLAAEFDGPAQVLTLGDRDQLEELVTEVVDGATAIADRSLYAGAGFGHFLILGRVHYESFHEVHARLVSQFGAARIRERFNVGTMTIVSGQRGLRLFSESLARSLYVVVDPGSGDGPKESPPHGSLEPGEVFADRFRVERRIDEGGFGTVYKVRDRHETGVFRALKVFTDGDGAAARREVAMLSKVSSEHVVQMIWGDQDPLSGLWYVVSEWVEGETLDVYVRGEKAGRLDDLRAVEVVRQILCGLRDVHPHDERLSELTRIGRERPLTAEEWDEQMALRDTGIIHRDIKPANVMLTPSGAVKLIDFNIASPAGAEMLTNKRTEIYAPPWGWPESVWRPQVDIYATGIIFYELLCNGNHPYSDSADAMVHPAEHRADLAPAQLQVLAKSCSLESCYSTAREMLSDLEEAWDTAHA